MQEGNHYAATKYEHAAAKHEYGSVKYEYAKSTEYHAAASRDYINKGFSLFNRYDVMEFTGG